MNVTRRTRVTALIGLLVLAAGLCLFARFVLFPPERIPRDAIRVPHDAASMADALGRVRPGGTIALDGREGPFPGPIDVNVPDITIRSYSRPARIVGQGSVPALTVHANGVALRGLAVSGGSVGLLVLSDRCHVEDVSFRDTSVALRFSGAGVPMVRGVDIEGSAIGIEISSTSGATISKANLRDLAEAGIRHTASWGSTLEAVDVLRAPIGVLIEGSSRDTRVLGFAFNDCAEGGLVVRDSTRVTADGGTVRDVGVGLRLDRATGCELRNTLIDRASTAGVCVSQSLQNAVRGNTIRAPGEAGILLIESSQNAITDNDIHGGTSAISLQTSDGNLIASNSIRGAAVGIRIDDAASALILRNTIAVKQCGVAITASSGGRVLQNRVTGGIFGVGVVSSTDTVVLRNVAEGQSGAGFALLGDTRGAFLRQNDVVRSLVGFLAAASSESDLLDNRAEKNEIGVLLFRCGAGLRIEGHRIESNAVGLYQTDDPADLPREIGLLGRLPSEAPLAIGPVVANNVFRGNRELDLKNTAQSPVRAAGNRWGQPAARVSANVTLDESAWKGTVAIGAAASDVDGVLGCILKAALSSAGYHVVDLVGVADSDLARQAVVAGDIDLAVGPSGDPAAELAEFMLPARAGWTAVVSAEVAAGLARPDLSALALHLAEQTQSLLLAVPESYDATQLIAFRTAYGLAEQIRAVVWAKTQKEAESLLAFGAAQFALLESLEETKTGAGFVALADDRDILPSATIAIAARSGFLSDHPDVAPLLSRIATRLTSSAVHGLVAQVRLLQRTPETVAAEFLAKENLLGK